MGHKQKKRRKLRLWEENPECHWCKQITNLDGGEADDNFATIDHLRSKKHPLRTEPCFFSNLSEPRSVLSCFGCNQLRSSVEVQNVSYDSFYRMYGQRFSSEEDARRTYDSCFVER